MSLNLGFVQYVKQPEAHVVIIAVADRSRGNLHPVALIFRMQIAVALLAGRQG